MLSISNAMILSYDHAGKKVCENCTLNRYIRYLDKISIVVAV